VGGRGWGGGVWQGEHCCTCLCQRQHFAGEISCCHGSGWWSFFGGGGSSLAKTASFWCSCKSAMCVGLAVCVENRRWQLHSLIVLCLASSVIIHRYLLAHSQTQGLRASAIGCPFTPPLLCPAAAAASVVLGFE
jgi:hypothetical protein